MLDHQLVTGFVVSCILLMVGALGFSVKHWVTGLTKTLDNLSTNIHELTEIIQELKQEQAIQRIRIKQQTLEIRGLQANQCPRTDCPHKTSPGVVAHLHARMQDIADANESGEYDAFTGSH